MLRKHAILAVAAALATLPAAAQYRGWYAGISGGESQTSHDLVSNRESTVVNGTATSSDFDSTDGAWKVFGGWQVNEIFAVEATYANLGRSHLVTNTLSTDQLAGTFDMTRKVDGFGIDAVIRGPVAPAFTVFARGGAFFSRTKADATLSGGIVFTDNPGQTSRSTTSSETVAHFGVGGEWAFRPNAALRLEWERFNNVGKAFQVGETGTTGEASMDLVTLGILMRF